MAETPENESFLAQLNEVDGVLDANPIQNQSCLQPNSSVVSNVVHILHDGSGAISQTYAPSVNHTPQNCSQVTHSNSYTIVSGHSQHEISPTLLSTPTASNSIGKNCTNNSSPVKLSSPGTPGTPGQPQTVTGNVKVQLMEIGVDEFKSNVQYIQQQFPALNRRQVCDAFSKANFDCQLAIDNLTREEERRNRLPLLATIKPPERPVQQHKQQLKPQAQQQRKLEQQQEQSQQEQNQPTSDQEQPQEQPEQLQQQQEQQQEQEQQSPTKESKPGDSSGLTKSPVVRSRRRDEQQQQGYKRVTGVNEEAERALKEKLRSNVRSRVFNHDVRLVQGRESAATIVESSIAAADNNNGNVSQLDDSDACKEQDAPAQEEEEVTEEKDDEEPQRPRQRPKIESPEPEDATVTAFRLLRESFPLLDDARISHCLQQCDYDVDASIRLLSGRSSTAAVAGDSAKFFKSKQLSKEQIKKEYVRAELNSGAWMDRPAAKNQQTPVRFNRQPLYQSKRKIKRETAGSDEEMSCVGDEDGAYNRERDYDSEDSDYENKHSVQSDEEKQAVLEFFNTSAVNELMHIPSVSKKKAELLAKMRPFSDFDDLIGRLDSHRQFNSSLVQSGREVLHMRRMIVYLMNKCEVITRKLEARVAALLDSVTLESAGGAGGITLQPAALNPDLKLKPYQMIGLNWLRLLHEENLSAILGDQMGLGKTIQIIAFLAQLLEEGDQGPHLVIVPSSTLVNWQREIEKWCPQLQALVYYGPMDERKAIRQEIYGGHVKFHILLTTYNIATGTLEDRAMMKNVEFEYGIFDEAHMLKNCQSRRYKVLMNFRVKRRILLTGTPLQNNLVELISLLSFVIPDVFTASRQCSELLKKMFNLFTRPSTTSDDSAPQSRTKYEMERIEHAKRLMRPFFLRRTKSQVLTQLPQKSEEVLSVPMSDRQRANYDELVDSLRRRFEEGGSRREQDVAVNYILQLRKAANHCLLQRRVYSDAQLREMAKRMLEDPGHRRANEDYIFEDLGVMNDYEVHKTCLMYPVLHEFALKEQDHLLQSGKLVMLDQLLPSLREQGHRVAIFSQFVMMLDILEAFLQLRDFRFLRIDGSTPVTDRQLLLDQFAEDKEILVFLLSTRAGGLGINLTAADTVVIHDIDFNPYNDKQAEDRCHRLGQERPVRVIRLLSENSVEEGMHRIAVDKLRLEKEVTNFKQEEDASDVASEAGSEAGTKAKKRKAAEAADDADAPQLQGNELVSLLSECLGVD